MLPRLIFFCFVLSVFGFQNAPCQEPVVELTPLRAEILLNGKWGFQPLGDKAPADAPSEITVPSSWTAKDTSPLFGGVTLPELVSAKYERQVEIPQGWQGRRIVLDLRRVSTEAEVTVNGKPCGRVDWPYGEVDITKAVRPGEPAAIEITVTARTPEGETWALMGYATEEKKKRTLASRGLIGDVLLKSEPAGARITDVFVKPSVRRKALDMDVELAGAKPGKWEFVAKMLNPAGETEKEFSSTAEVGADGKAQLSFPWENPRLWDFEKPELYTLHLSAKPEGAAQPADIYPQTFGFREFWIEGRDFYLNGHKVRLRPRGGHGVPAHPATMRAFIEGSRDAGFNISQIWPEDALEPGQWNFWEQFADEASRAGWALIGAAPSVKDPARNEVDGVPVWTAKPEVRAAWVAAMEREMKRYRNYPAILLWGTSGNLNNHFGDQNPDYLGQQAKLLKHPQWPNSQKVAREALEEIRKVDPTRPVFVHAGSRLGDVFTVNHYLNLLPLQEREEMLSGYMRHGDVPYIGIEFGTPLNTTMNRGRAGFGPSHKSEPFATEYAAIYFGPEAYAKEPRAYRRNVRFGYTGKDWDGDWSQVQWLQSSGEPFQDLQALFIRNTWRSWRASGVTGGMIPWNDLNQTFLIRDRSKRTPAPEPAPGQRGPRPESLATMDLQFMKPEGGWTEMAAAKALRESNAPVMAFIGGPAPTEDDPVAFTAKDHHFATGAQIKKSAVLINDTSTNQPYQMEWTAVINGKEVAKGSKSGDIGPAENLFLPIEFTASTSTQSVRMEATGASSGSISTSSSSASASGGSAPDKTQGEIRLTASIGGRKVEDAFAFTVFAAAKPQALPPVLVFDPEGRTSAMLAGLGIKTQPWDGKPSGSLLVIGREALSKRHKLPGSLAEFVNAGGRAILFTQHPDFLRDAMGFRVARHVSRRVFPVSASHPALGGLEAADLQDWSSSGTLLPPRENVPVSTIPPYGWRWGNRGSVSSAMIEKPHRSGWRPILEGEFDLAYSPLMELTSGKGLAILCTLDLEDAWKTDPAADRLARTLLAYAATAKPAPSRNTLFIGSDADFNFLTNDLGVIAQKADHLPVGNALAILGPDAKLPAAQLDAFAKAGGNVVVLAQNRPGEAGLAGGNLTTAKSFIGGRAALPAWPATAGLGVSDTRFRSDLDWTIFGNSPETMAEGLLHVRNIGAGRIVQAQFEPRWFQTDKMPMFRLTRWRHTRALAQALANAGAQFTADARSLEPRARRISLAGPWKVKVTAPLPVTGWDKPHTDPGMSEAAKAAVQPGFDDSQWDSFDLPAWYPPFDEESGEAVWRKSVTIPPEWAGQILQLGVGRVKTYDNTFLNGQQVGATGPTVKDAWNLARRYRIPANLVKGGEMVIAIREFVTDRQGGIHGLPDEMFLRPVAAGSKAEEFYHPDYKEEFDFGDDPYRYYRW